MQKEAKEYGAKELALLDRIEGIEDPDPEAIDP